MVWVSSIESIESLHFGIDIVSAPSIGRALPWGMVCWAMVPWAMVRWGMVS